MLIQLNHLPNVEQVLLGELTVDGEEFLFPADQPYTSCPTGHETWIGTSDRIFFSTRYDAEKNGNIWIAKSGEGQPVLVGDGKQSFVHVSVSICGRYWIGDSNVDGIPVLIGRFGSMTHKRLIFSWTEYDGKQWSHAHPYLTADNQWLIFNSRRNGHPQVYGAKLTPGWLDSLRDAGAS